MQAVFELEKTIVTESSIKFGFVIRFFLMFLHFCQIPVMKHLVSSQKWSWKFVVCLFVCEKILMQTNYLFEQLLEGGLNIVEAKQLI